MAPQGVSSCSLPSLLSVASSTAKSAKKVFTSVKKVATAVARPFKKSRKSQASDSLSISDTSTPFLAPLFSKSDNDYATFVDEDLNSECPPPPINVDASQDQDSDKQEEEGETDEQELSEFFSMIYAYIFSPCHVRAPQEYLAFISLRILQIQGPGSIRKGPKISSLPMCCQEVQRTWLCSLISRLSRPRCNIQSEDACAEVFQR